VADIGHLIKRDQLALRPGSSEGIQHLWQYLLTVVVANQSAVSSGLLSVTQLNDMHRCPVEWSQQQGAYLEPVMHFRPEV